MLRKRIVLLVLPLALSGCLSQSKIQTSYIRQQGECRSVAENSVMAKPDEHTNQNVTGYNLAKEFSECMAKNGWHVASPKAPPTQVAQTPPGVFPGPNNPVALSARPVAMQPAQAGVAAQAKPVAVPAASSPAAVTHIPSNNAAAASAASIPQQRAATSASTGSAPSAAPQIGPGVVPNPPPAEYEPAPARPAAVPTTNYGTGAGRQF